ncbi:hypothetical protein GJ744_006725 [Endocarpon pusillum]|uniref:Heme oxygenase-like protein n=1 Tax=Endocarpon pusillum TaxID=364733 RepID=A0A8H7E858_9EURO|nr:hypothetical protein GJ744_006725 [Endocarpon pusillum]
MSGPTHNASDPPYKSLPLEIHAATRSYHTSLNRLITSRLPLCLPPYAWDASTYLHGISTFAEIYLTFESEWISIVSSTASIDVSLRAQSLLRASYHPSLLRSARLKHDLSLLSHQYAKHERLLPLTNLTSRIRTRIQSRPHTLLAYTWIMYLALFNGGRWIRAQLLSTANCTSHKSFWPDGHSAEECLSFWHFDGDQGGEDIKNDFKTRFQAVAAQMSKEERQDVVSEAVEIFKMCDLMVEDLDQAFADQYGKEERRSVTPSSTASFMTEQLYGILTWICGLVWAAVSITERGGGPAGHVMVSREEVGAERR